jgi:hypothetical protein
MIICVNVAGNINFTSALYEGLILKNNLAPFRGWGLN